jgi:hypothetical protein
MGPRKRKNVHFDEPAMQLSDASDGSEGEGAGGPTKKRKRATAGVVSSFFLPHAEGSKKTLADLRLDNLDSEGLQDLIRQVGRGTDLVGAVNLPGSLLLAHWTGHWSGHGSIHQSNSGLCTLHTSASPPSLPHPHLPAVCSSPPATLATAPSS